MNNLWSLLIEIGLLAFLGILYYFYQKKKILQYEADKGPLVMGMILQACLVEKDERSSEALDQLIEALDDYLHDRVQTPPVTSLRAYSLSPECSAELRNVINEGLNEWEKK